MENESNNELEIRTRQRDFWQSERMKEKMRLDYLIETGKSVMQKWDGRYQIGYGVENMMPLFSDARDAIDYAIRHSSPNGSHEPRDL